MSQVPLTPCRPQLQRSVLAAERPDLVVFSGDMVSGWMCGEGAAPPAHAGDDSGGGDGNASAGSCSPGWYEARWEQLTAAVREASIPWAVVLGNHE